MVKIHKRKSWTEETRCERVGIGENMNLVAIALLCQVTGATNPYQGDGQALYDVVKIDQIKCQKYYVKCWNKKREGQLEKSTPYDPEGFLAKCVLERP
jgi:hypothetical protein